jgi:hypothetical protein
VARFEWADGATIDAEAHGLSLGWVLGEECTPVVYVGFEANEAEFDAGLHLSAPPVEGATWAQPSPESIAEGHPHPLRVDRTYYFSGVTTLVEWSPDRWKMEFGGEGFVGCPDWWHDLDTCSPSIPGTLTVEPAPGAAPMPTVAEGCVTTGIPFDIPELEGLCREENTRYEPLAVEVPCPVPLP